jgi:hypothetical protein
MNGETTFRTRGQVVLRTIGTDTLLVPVSGPAASGRIYPLNETARLIWTCFAEGGTVVRAISALTARYQVSEAEAAADCEACARMFLEESLIEESTP